MDKKLRCSSIVLHNFKDNNITTKCEWCKKSLEQIYKDHYKNKNKKQDE